MCGKVPVKNSAESIRDPRRACPAAAAAAAADGGERTDGRGRPTREIRERNDDACRNAGKRENKIYDTISPRSDRDFRENEWMRTETLCVCPSCACVVIRRCVIVRVRYQWGKKK